MLTRILEPEVMDTESEAFEYDRMDHSTVNRIFVDDLLNAWSKRPQQSTAIPYSWQVFDAGTGTAQIPLELLRRGFPGIVTASDLAEQMLIVAKKNVEAAGLSASVRLVHTDCKHLPDADGTYDIVMSNSIIHHIPEPRHVFAELGRILKSGGLLFVRDLMRPADQQTLDGLVQTYAGDANRHQQQMFRDSLHAALSVAEVNQILREAGVSGASQATSDRHWTITAWKA
jgi:ubiquinone/menaquinone biosynthesis C-methylase UbiE